MDRIINLILWYRELRIRGAEMGVTNKGAWYSRYNRLNCLWWATQNSGTHYTDGTYFK